jgi:3-isopropylmalate dehydrogenase
LYSVAVLGGDFVGPEVMEEALRVLSVVQKRAGINITYQHGLIGGCAIDREGMALPQATLRLCQTSDAVLHGSVGGPKWDYLPAEINPGPGGLLKLRRLLGLFANLRPYRTYVPVELAMLVQRPGTRINMLLLREANGGLYFAEPRGREALPDGGERAFDTKAYTTQEVERIVDLAFRLARERRQEVCSVDKSNVLESCKLWREVATRVGEKYPDVPLRHMYVDNFAMQLVLNPLQFGVVVTENLFGDILSDEAAALVGSLGLAPSASLRGDRFGLYEPVHGSAPDIAGQGKANPAAMILSAAMMLRYSLGRPDAADAVENAVQDVLDAGLRTPDLWREGCQRVTTAEFGEHVGKVLGRA